MNQLYKVTVNNEVVTDDTSQCTISEQTQRFYNTATFYTSLVLIPETVVVIEYGDKVFSGFIASVKRTNKGIYSVECRTQGGYLTEPFISSKTDIVIPVTTSHALCAYYANLYNIPIVITAIDLDFGGEYEQKGTVISALTSIANVTGADFYFDGTSIIIEPAKWIEEDGSHVDPRNIIDFEPFSQKIDQNGVRYITVGNSQSAGNATINMSCNAKVDGCTAQTMLRVIPHDALEYTKGLNSLTPVQTPMIYKGIMSMQSYLELEADIVSIQSVRINEMVVTDYSFINNTLIFSSPKRGMAMIDYVGYGYSGYANNKIVEGKKIYAFSVFYGDCNVFYGDGELSCTDGSPDGQDRNSYNECGDVMVVMPDTTNYVKGFSFLTFGGTPYIYFYNGTSKVNLGISHTIGMINKLDPVVLSGYGNDPAMRYKFRYSVSSVNGVKSLGASIPYTFDNEYLYLDKFYPGVSVSYKTKGRTYTVKNKNLAGGDVVMVLGSTTEGDPCEYFLTGEDLSDPNTLSCLVGTDVPVDIVEIHGITLDFVEGKTIEVIAPDGSHTSYQANSFGQITILNVQNGTYIIDTGNCYPDSSITMISKAV